MASHPKRNMFDFTQLGGSTFSGPDYEGNIFVSGFEDIDLEVFTRQVITAEQNPEVENIFIWVSSYGGNVHNCLAMIDLLESVHKAVFTIAYGKAMSAGCLLVASGKVGNRFATPNSYMMIHEASGGAGGKTQDVIQQAAELSELNDKVIKLISKYARKKHNELKKLLQGINNTDLVLSSDRALQFGLIDHIGVPKPIPAKSAELVGIFGKPSRAGRKKSKST